MLNTQHVVVELKHDLHLNAKRDYCANSVGRIWTPQESKLFS